MGEGHASANRQTERDGGNAGIPGTHSETQAAAIPEAAAGTATATADGGTAAKVQVLGGQTARLSELSGREPGKRGRHKKDCDCEKCQAKRSGQSFTSSGSSSGSGSAPKMPKIETKPLVEIGLNLTFNMVAARAGAHWQLQKNESDALAGAISDVLKQYDLERFIGENGHWYALAMTAAAVFTPRVMYQTELNKARKGAKQNVQQLSTKQRERQQQQPEPNPNAGTSNDSNRESSRPDTHAFETGLKSHLVASIG